MQQHLAFINSEYKVSVFISGYCSTIEENKKVDHTINLNLLSTHSNSTSTPMTSTATFPSCWDEKLCEENDSDFLESSDTEFDKFYNKHITDQCKKSSNNVYCNLDKIIYAEEVYGIIDTGTTVSLISKRYAIKNNIKFHSVPAGILSMANGFEIPRLQTVDLVYVEYDNDLGIR
ncbi:hypothetical protein BD770DRAFT_469430 [Pilaira anomala]|nr:hypothetical protein BD770DRAFT_469430 [Pilaira anomala]